MSLSATALAVTYTAQQILERGLTVARLLGLAVSSWQAGDPTRALFKHLAEELALRDTIDAEYTKSAFLSTAEGDWLTVHAKEVYGIDRGEADYARPTVTFLNNGGGFYTKAPGEVTVKSTLTGKTYHNDEAFELLGVGTTATVNFVADEPGTGSNCGVNEIDDFVTVLLEVEITASGAATGVDAQSDPDLRTACLNTLGALSPNGPPDAYDAVIFNPDLTGTTEITRTQYVLDATNGSVAVYLAGPAGQVSAGAVTAAQTAAYAYARPIGFTPIFSNSTEDEVSVTATISGVGLPADYATQAATAFTAMLQAAPIGGKISRSSIISLFQVLATDAGATDVSVTLALPAADVDLADGHVPVVGAFSLTEI